MIGVIGVQEVFAQLYARIAGGAPEPVTFGAGDPVLAGRFRVDPAAAACVGAATLAAAELFRARGGSAGPVGVDVRHAAVAFGSERYLLVDGGSPGLVWADISGDYRAADGWVRLHANYPHHGAAIRRALAVTGGRDEVADAVGQRPAIEVEEAVLAAGGAAAALRTRAEWLAHPAGQAVRESPLVAVDRIGDAPARQRGPADRPLAGVRVLDLTHVIAGPVCGRVLAAYGADVLHVGAAHLPTVRPLVIDNGFGKRSAHLDLRTETGREALRALVREADVLVQSFRPGTLAARGFGPAELAELSPGIVLVDVSAYGHVGPWRRRRGFDSLAQLATGIADLGARLAGVDEPVPLPVQAMDHGTGWLAAAAVLTTLRRQAAEGGSWQLRLSLARTGEWLVDLGLWDQPGPASPTQAEVADLLAEVDSQFGRITQVRMPGDLPGAQPFWADGPHLPGTDPAVWC